jgi:hypothetical protein
MRRGWSRVPRRLGAEGGADKNRDRRDGGEEHGQRRPIKRRCRGQRQPERARPGGDRDSVVAIGDADPAIGDPPDDLAQRDGDHDKAEPGAAQCQQGEDPGAKQRRRERAKDGDEVIGAAVDEDRPGIGGKAEEPCMAERNETGVADQHVEPQRENGIEQDLRGDVDIIAVGDPERQGRQRDYSQCQDEPSQSVAARPKRPCGRNTRTISIGRNSTT